MRGKADLLSAHHVPVLSEEVLELLALRPGATVADATLGLAGHASLIARRIGPRGTLIAFDRDPDALRLAMARLDALHAELGAEMPRVRVIARDFGSIAAEVEPHSLHGLLADFGVSSLQLDTPERGFSFRQEGALDMRMDPRTGRTAEQVVNEEDEVELANLIYTFGEERRSRRIARAIVRARPITTTAQLARVVSAAAPAMKSDKIHPATRTFQALRIAVNSELDQISKFLEAAPNLLRPGGRVVCISFHSLEDRQVKDAFRAGLAQGVYSQVSKKPITAGELEIEKNARSRSAKARMAEREQDQVGRPVSKSVENADNSRRAGKKFRTAAKLQRKSSRPNRKA